MHSGLHHEDSPIPAWRLPTEPSRPRTRQYDMSPPPRRESFRTDSNRRCPGINRVLSPLTHGVLWRAFPQTPLLSTVCRMFHSVDSPGIAPGSPACKTGIFLLDHEPVLFRFPCIPEGAPSTEAVGLAPSTESLPYPLESQTPDPAGRLARTPGKEPRDQPGFLPSHKKTRCRMTPGLRAWLVRKLRCQSGRAQGRRSNIRNSVR